MLENLKDGQKLTPIMMIHKEIANVMLDFLLFFALENDYYEDNFKRIEPSLDTLIPGNPNTPYDMKELILKIV